MYCEAERPTTTHVYKQNVSNTGERLWWGVWSTVVVQVQQGNKHDGRLQVYLLLILCSLTTVVFIAALVIEKFISGQKTFLNFTRKSKTIRNHIMIWAGMTDSQPSSWPLFLNVSLNHKLSADVEKVIVFRTDGHRNNGNCYFNKTVLLLMFHQQSADPKNPRSRGIEQCTHYIVIDQLYLL